MDKKSANLSRRDFLKFSAVTFSSLAFAELTGCISLPARDLPVIDKNKGMILKNGFIIDVVNNKIIKNKSIIVEQGKIVSIVEQNSSAIIETNYEVIDLNSHYILPGFIDAHCHSTLPSAGEFDPFGLRTTMRQMQRNYFQHIESGTTTIRDTGAFPNYLHNFIKEIEAGKMTGPRITYCNGIVNKKGGHPDIDPADVTIFAGPTSYLTGDQSTYYTSREDMIKKMNENIKNGGSFIKLTMDDVSVMCGKSKLAVYSDDDLKYIFDFAAEHNIPVAGHIHRKFGFDRGLKFGINSMEHTIGDAVISDKEIQLMAQKNIAIVPTMVIAQMLAAEEAYDTIPAEYDTPFIRNELKIRHDFLYNPQDRFIEPEIHIANTKNLKSYKEFGCANLYQNKKFLVNPEIYFGVLKYGPDNIRRMHSAGITIGAGTDGGVPFSYNGTIAREFELLSRIGFKNEDIIKFATINNAKILRMQDKIGSIENNKFADFAIVKENPYTKIESLRSPDMVIKEGKILFTKNMVKKTGNVISL